MVERLNTKRKIYLIALAFGIGILIIIGGYFYYRYEKNVIRQEKLNEIKTIAKLKIDQITSWQSERLGDADEIFRNPFFARDVEQFIFNGFHKELKNNILSQLSFTKNQGGYENIFLTTPSGTVLFAVDPLLARIESKTKEFIAEAAVQRNVIFTDLYYCPLHRKIHYDLMVPVFNKSNISIATLVFRVDPDTYLFKLIQTWPTPSRSSETLIVRKNGDSVLFLNELRFHEHSALSFQLPITRNDVPSVRAVLGYEGIVEGPDYRNVDVLAYVCRIPESPWFLIAKIDQTEIFSEISYRTGLITFVTIILIILTAVAISWYHYARQRNIYRELFQKEQNLTEMEEEYRTTLYSIADGVITTDELGRVRHMNPVAQQLTGFKEYDATGRLLVDVFRIVDERTRERVDIPLEQVIKQGLVAEIKFNSLLSSTYGVESPISGNCSPVTHTNNNVIGAVVVFRDQTAEREFISKLKGSEELYRELFENMLNGFAYCRMIFEQESPVDFIYLKVNKAFEVLTGLKDVVGKKVSEVIPGIQTADRALIERYGRVSTTGLPEEFETYVESMKMWYSISVYSPETEYFVAVFDVITARKQAEEKLKQSNSDLERSNKELEQFAYIASHDLQEPLRMVSSFTQLLSKRYKNKLGDDAEEFIQYIIDGAYRMQRLIQDLLSYSRINVNDISMNPTDSHQALGEAISNLQVSIKESAAIVTTGDLPVIHANFGQIVQVFQNLISNALKFHRDDAPRIHISAIPGNGEWVFTVTDNGIGIEEQYFSRIFIIFQRLHAGSTYPGTGIGLAICNRIIQRHEGRIWVESEPGKGSVFYFSIKK